VIEEEFITSVSPPIPPEFDPSEAPSNKILVDAVELFFPQQLTQVVDANAPVTNTEDP
jgi:hypothetical protein